MLALIITYYNNREALDQFLASLRGNTKQSFTLYIADLSKTLHDLDKYSFPVVIIPGRNKGYSYGVNLCLKQALKDGADQFCVMNYDTITSPSFIDEVQKGFLSADAFGGKIYYEKNYEYHKSKYAKKDLGKVLWYAGGSINWEHALVHHRGVDEIDNGSYDIFEKTEFVSGCLFCFSIMIVKTVGFWDPRYFLYYEDADYSVRISRKGIPLYYNPTVVLYHKNAGSTGGAGSALHQKTQAWSRLIFGMKFAPWRTKAHLAINYVLSYLHA